MIEWLTTSQVARRWGVSSRTVQRLLVARKLVGFKPAGGHWRVPLSEVLAYEDKRAGA